MKIEPKSGDVWMYEGKELVIYPSKRANYFDVFYGGKLHFSLLPKSVVQNVFVFVRRAQIFSDEDYEKIFI